MSQRHLGSEPLKALKLKSEHTPTAAVCVCEIVSMYECGIFTPILFEFLFFLSWTSHLAAMGLRRLSASCQRIFKSS